MMMAAVSSARIVLIIAISRPVAALGVFSERLCEHVLNLVEAAHALEQAIALNIMDNGYGRPVIAG